MNDQNPNPETQDDKAVTEAIALADLDFKDLAFNSEVNGTTAVLKATDKGYYLKKAKEAGISEETIKNVSKFDETFLNAVTDSIADASEKTFLGDKAIEKVITITPFGLEKSASIKTTLVRQRTHPIPNTDDGTGKPKTVTKPSLVIEVIRPSGRITKTKRKAIENRLKETIINA